MKSECTIGIINFVRAYVKIRILLTQLLTAIRSENKIIIIIIHSMQNVGLRSTNRLT